MDTHAIIHPDHHRGRAPDGSLALPQTLESVEPRLPLWSEEWEEQVRPRLLTLPKQLGFTRLNGLLWSLYIDRFFAQVMAYGHFCREQGKLEDYHEELIRFQADLVNALSDNGCPSPEARDMNGLTFERSIRHYANKMRDHWIARRAFGACEKTAKWFSASFLAFPLIAVAYHSLKVGWTPVVFGTTMILSLAICMTYLIGLRSIYSTWDAAGKRAQDCTRHEPGLQLSRGKNWAQLAAYVAALLVLTGAWVTVDAKFLVMATLKDAWGDLNPARIQEGEALRIAAVFNVLLLFSSWGYLHISDAIKWSKQKADELISDLRTRMAQPLTTVKGRMGEIERLQALLPAEKEAVLHSSRVAAWVDVFVVLTAMTKYPGRPEVEDRIIDHIGDLGCGAAASATNAAVTTAATATAIA